MMDHKSDISGVEVHVPTNDLGRSWLVSDTAVRAACLRVLESGWFINGPELKAFEQELADYVGTRHAIGVGNGTDALRLAMRALGCRPGSTVLTSANSGGYAALAAASLGATCEYADVDPESLLLTPESVIDAMSPTTSLVVVTHLYGNVADVAGIAAACHEKGIPVIEDCAQAIGGRRGGVGVGAMADAAAFSFYPTKNLGAAGDGGAVATWSPTVAEEVRRLRNYGWGHRYEIKIEGGLNSRLDELQAAILRVGLTHIDALNETRRSVVERYQRALEGSSRFIATGMNCETTAHLAVLVTTDPADQKRCAALLADCGIQTSIHYPILDTQQEGLSAHSLPASLPISENIVGRILTLPCFPEMTEDEISNVCDRLSCLPTQNSGHGNHVQGREL